MLPSLGMEQKLFLETTFVAMCNEQTQFSIRRLSDFRRELAPPLSFKLAVGESPISSYLTYIVSKEPEHEHLQLKNDVLVFSHKQGLEGDSSKQKIWNVT